MAELDCGHNQHVRHRPPFQWRDWVLDAAGRQSRVDSRLDCPLCDRAELPQAVRSVRTAKWDESTLPAALRRAHRLGSGTWGRIRVQGGRLRFRAATAPPIDRELVAGSEQAIPPGVIHQVDPAEGLLMSLEFLTVDRDPPAETTRPPEPDVGGEGAEGGDPACWAALVCPECGGVAGDGSGHRPGCPARPPAS